MEVMTTVRMTPKKTDAMVIIVLREFLHKFLQAILMMFIVLRFQFSFAQCCKINRFILFHALKAFAVFSFPMNQTA